MDLLRSQLDPHTLYNSLAVMRLHACMNNDTETPVLIDTLVDYYRDILNKNRGTISTLSKELSVIKKFIKISSISHEQPFILKTDISPDASRAECLPMLLHPFIENAIIHGLSGLTRECIIEIRAWVSDSMLTIQIKDNGRGIAPNTLKNINEFDNNKKGYGIFNSYKRLKIAYGDKCHLSIKSIQNEYTAVEISFKYDS